MTRRDGALATTAAATLWILLASAVVGGVLELAALVSGTAAVDVAHQVWSPLGAVTGLLRVALLATLGFVVSATVLAVGRRLRRGAAVTTRESTAVPPQPRRR